MPYTAVRYAYDPTGINHDNLVINETHSLESTPMRVVAPTYGAYFTESIRVYDNNTDKLLIKDTQYICVELLQEPTIQLGKEICTLVIITDSSVSPSVRLTYQALGGHYQNNANNIDNLYKAHIADSRPVDFIDIINKPAQYPPTLHEHILRDVYGFGPVVNALERIRGALVLNNVPAFESLIDYVNEQLKTATRPENLIHATYDDIDKGLPNDRVITTDVLLYALSKRDKLTLYSIKPRMSIAGALTGEYILYIDVSGQNLPLQQKLYWAVDHVTTIASDFKAVMGSINYTPDTHVFAITLTNKEAFLNKTFKVELRLGSPTGQRVSTSNTLIATHHYMTSYAERLMLSSESCPMKPNDVITATTLFYSTMDDSGGFRN